MKTLLWSVSCLVWCWVFTKYTAFFGDFRLPGKLPVPKAVGEELASPSYSSPVDPAPAKLVESICRVRNKDSLSKTAGRASQSSSTVGSVLGQQQSLSELFMMTAQDNPQQALFLIDDALAKGTPNKGASAEGLIFSLLPMLAYQHGDLAENWLQGADLDDELKAQVREMIAGARTHMTSFPISSQFDRYPPMMPDGSMYQLQFMND